MVFFLDMGLEKVQLLTENRLNKIDGLTQKDIHESSESHLRKASAVADALVEEYGWVRITCVADGKILPPEEIAEAVYKEFLAGNMR